MDINALSKRFRVLRLGEEDVERIYELSCGNRIFYQYHPPFVTRESIREDMTALPPHKTEKDKFYVGFFEREELIAVLDLILGYPEETVAWIGLFMMEACRQNRGIGSAIIGEIRQCLKARGYKELRLGVDRGNPQSYAFWSKNGFTVLREEAYIQMRQEME